MTDRDFVKEVKEIGDLLDESMLVSTILNYARRGRATTIMVEQAILLVERHIAYAERVGDGGQLNSSIRLRDGLRQALVDGIETLRSEPVPGPEMRNVERPLADSLLRAGHSIRRQHRTSVGIIDIFDLTTDEIIECKARGSSAALGEAAGQLQRYRAAFPGASLTIAVPKIEADAEWLADLLRSQGVSIIEVGSS